ncbi:unnamed protein product [Closterium sp. NIES-65]|nr:unnamed protein product [Closterium sp. NIES-65]
MAFLRTGNGSGTLDVTQLAAQREQQMVQRWRWQREQEGPLEKVVGGVLNRLLPDAPAMAARADIVAVLTQAIRVEFRAGRLIPFGSYEMGLSSNTSDLDLSMEVSPHPSLAPSFAVGMMAEPRTRDAKIAVLRRVAAVIRRMERGWNESSLTHNTFPPLPRSSNRPRPFHHPPSSPPPVPSYLPLSPSQHLPPFSPSFPSSFLSSSPFPFPRPAYGAAGQVEWVEVVFRAIVPVVERVEVVFRAIVPVVKFVHSRSLVECDISVANRDGFFKSRFIRFVSSIDPRFRHLCFLVKAWARNEAINDPRNGTLNSLALILLCSLHLQRSIHPRPPSPSVLLLSHTRSPPILPPFKDLMGQFPEPLTSGRDAVPLPEQELMDRLAHAESRAAQLAEQGYGKRNTESLPHLLASFFIQMAAQEDLWEHMLCASVYEGKWIPRDFPQENHVTVMAIEDFYHRSSNCARTVRPKEFTIISAAFSRAAQAVMDVPCPPPSLSSASSLVDLLFGFSPVDLEDSGKDERNRGGLSRRGRDGGWDERGEREERGGREGRRRDQKRGREWSDDGGEEGLGGNRDRFAGRGGGMRVGGRQGRWDEDRWNGGERGVGPGALEGSEKGGDRWRGVVEEEEEKEDWRTRPITIDRPTSTEATTTMCLPLPLLHLYKAHGQCDKHLLTTIAHLLLGLSVL